MSDNFWCFGLGGSCFECFPTGLLGQCEAFLVVLLQEPNDEPVAQGDESKGKAE